MAGTPVVATAAGGRRTVVQDGETGRRVPIGQRQALAAAVADVITDSEGAKEMAHRARNLAERNFGLERMVAEHEALYRQVING